MYSFSQNVVRRQNSGCLWRNRKLSVGNGEYYNFQVRHPRCVEYKLKYNIKIYNIVIHNFIFYCIILDYNCSYVFRPNCRAMYNCTLRLFKDQPEDGPTIGQKHVDGTII